MIRTTIMLDDKVSAKIRDIQAKEIKDTGRSFSFSACCNMNLGEGIKMKSENRNQRGTRNNQRPINEGRHRTW
jgi:hypothetical protein